MEDLGSFYGEDPIPPFENENRLNSILRGTRNPTEEERRIIADTLEVSVDWLLYGGEYPELDWEASPMFKWSLRTFREMHHLTQKAFTEEMRKNAKKCGRNAEKMGMKPLQISKFENGTPVPQSVIDCIREKYGEDIREN